MKTPVIVVTKPDRNTTNRFTSVSTSRSRRIWERSDRTPFVRLCVAPSLR